MLKQKYMVKLNDLVDEVYLINLEKRKDRYDLASKQLAQVCTQFTTIRPIPHGNPKVSFNETCLWIMKGVVQENDHGINTIHRIAVFEDDFEFKFNNINESANDLVCGIYSSIVDLEMIEKLSWDILYLGANLRDGVPNKISPDTYQIFKAWTTHAVIYNFRAINYIARNYKDTSVMFDAWLSDQIEAGELTAFVTAPMVAWQRPGVSDIWGGDQDYTNCFVESEKLLR